MRGDTLESNARIKALQNKLHRLLQYRDGKISAAFRKNRGIYEALTEISRHIELFTGEARTALINCHDELQALGYRPQELPMQDAPDIDVKADEQSVRIAIDGMMPYPINGSAHYLHKKLDAALTRYAADNMLPPPLFTERCAVVFVHHYEENGKAIRNMRDYDNVERRCITNVIARHFLRDDSPACYISMDILAPGESSFTEIRLLAIPAFRALFMSGEIEYFPCATVSKKIPKTYQKT
jgi:hypothetical protein